MFLITTISAALFAGFGGTAEAKTVKKVVPCSKHTAHTKVTRSQCLAQYRKTVRDRLRARNLQAKRDRMKWPPKPVTARDLRVRGVNIQNFARLGKCEAGPGSGRFGVRWNTPRGWTWQGGLGMYNRTHQSVGHPYGRDIGQESWQVQMLVGDRVRQKYGISAWEAFRKRPGACWYG